jgi:mannose-1-phosphate guanylyltransferase/mannose-1-phosphate guanylyltransferase/mannose-6-phosphate isomerase
MRPDIVPVILAGGEGRRLRPLTSPSRPKPFLKLFSGSSLLQTTLRRVKNFLRPVIVCDIQFADDAEEEARQVHTVPGAIIGEPMQRGTAAAIACAAFLLQQENPVMLVMPSDHVIADVAFFEETIARAAEMLPEDAPIILGKRPDSAADRYGYIRTRAENGAFVLDSFIEKPARRIAKKLIAQDNVFWNTGIFLIRARTFLHLLSLHAPGIFERVGSAMALAETQGVLIIPEPKRYGAVPRESVDHAIMEKLQAGFVLPLETGWHDVGCWERIFALKIREFAGKPGLFNESRRRSE